MYLPEKKPSGLKRCRHCKVDYPATTQYFGEDASKEDGFATICKVCRQDEEDERQKRRRDHRLQMIDDASFKLLENMARGGSDVPHMAEIYQRLMDVYEGAGGYAAHFMAQYLESKPGGTTRTKMLEMIMRIGMKVSEAGNAQIPLELMSDEDLKIKLDEHARRIYRIEDHQADDDRASEKAS